MNKLTSILIIALLLMTTACDKSTKETPNGFKYEIAKAGNGVTPKVGEILVFDYVLKDSRDSVWADTRKTKMPAAVMINDTSALKKENGMVQMFRQLSIGDSVKTEMSVKKFFNDIVGGPIPKGIDTTLTLHYFVHVTDITDREKYTAKQQEIMEKKMAEQLNIDTIAIDKYLTEKGIVAQKTKSGLRYVITKPGKGPTSVSGQNVMVNYAGYLLNGHYFDTSIKSVAEEKGIYNPRREPYNPIGLTIDRSRVISGWHEALKLLNKGAKGTFYIPSTLGYGPEQISAELKPNSILIFDIELVDVKDDTTGKPAGE